MRNLPAISVFTSELWEININSHSYNSELKVSDFKAFDEIKGVQENVSDPLHLRSCLSLLKMDLLHVRQKTNVVTFIEIN